MAAPSRTGKRTAPGAGDDAPESSGAAAKRPRAAQQPTVLTMPAESRLAIIKQLTDLSPRTYAFLDWTVIYQIYTHYKARDAADKAAAKAASTGQPAPAAWAPPAGTHGCGIWRVYPPLGFRGDWPVTVEDIALPRDDVERTRCAWWDADHWSKRAYPSGEKPSASHPLSQTNKQLYNEVSYEVRAALVNKAAVVVLPVDSANYALPAFGLGNAASRQAMPKVYFFINVDDIIRQTIDEDDIPFDSIEGTNLIVQRLKRVGLGINEVLRDNTKLTRLVIHFHLERADLIDTATRPDDHALFAYRLVQKMLHHLAKPPTIQQVDVRLGFRGPSPQGANMVPVLADLTLERHQLGVGHEWRPTNGPVDTQEYRIRPIVRGTMFSRDIRMVGKVGQAFRRSDITGYGTDSE